jgi:hypothetical protein
MFAALTVGKGKKKRRKGSHVLAVGEGGKKKRKKKGKKKGKRKW